MKRKDPAAVTLGRKGGRARMKKMTPEERTKLGRQAAIARWDRELDTWKEDNKWLELSLKSISH